MSEPTFPPSFHVYDTTLRDGAQQEGLTLSVEDKLAIARHLDELGVGYIEGGWPGAIPKDTEFFARAAAELDLRTATLAAFGATRRAGVAAADDPQVRALLDSLAPVVTLVAKSDVRHVEQALRTTPRGEPRDGPRHRRLPRRRGPPRLPRRRALLRRLPARPPPTRSRSYGPRPRPGAEVVALCDTNGGMLPAQIADVVDAVRATTGGVALGIHCHNDTGCAVANTPRRRGRRRPARPGHAQRLRRAHGQRRPARRRGQPRAQAGPGVLPAGRLAEATRIAHAVSEITNVPPYSRQPYVGVSAFAHKAGLHASAIKVDPDLYQHADPDQVGNDMRMLVSDMAGRASIELKGRELGSTCPETGSCSRASPTG